MIDLLAAIVATFPRAFRDEFGAEMLDHARRDLAAARERGHAAHVVCAVATTVNLVWSSVAERVRPSWTTHSPQMEIGRMESLRNGWMRDLSHAGRTLRRSPAFSAIAIGTLALAIGVNAGMFNLVDTVLLHPLPYVHPDRLVAIAATAPGTDFPPEFGLSDEFVVSYRERSKLVEDIATYNYFTSTLRVGDRVERVPMSWPTNSLFSTLGAKPIFGRLPRTEDGDKVVVISYQLWKGWFNGDSSVLGKSYSVSGDMRTIVGVMGPEFRFPTDRTMLWISSEIRTDSIQPGRFGDGLVARLKPGATREALATELTSIGKDVPNRFGGSPSYLNVVSHHRVVVRSLRKQLLGDVEAPLWVLLGAVVLVLLIACANVANLFMVRSEGRQRDLAIRRAIGAARSQLIQTQMAESLIVAAVAAVLAVGFAWLTLPAFLRTAPPEIPRLGDVHLDARTLLYTLGAALIAATACGLVPAIRGSSPDLMRLREGGRGSTRSHNVARDSLVIGQTALALVLLIGSGLLVRSFWALRHVNPGYTTENIFTFQIAPTSPALVDGMTYAQFDLNFLNRLKALPGVEMVGLVENIPLDEGTANTRIRAEGSSAEQGGGSMLHYTYTAGDYFKLMNIAVMRGRVFDNDDHLTNQRNVIVSKSAANLLWPGQDPVGKRLQRNGLDTWETVVGVVDDVMQNSFREAPQAVVYFPLVGPQPRSWIVSSPAYVVKTKRAEVIGPEVRALVRQVAPTAPMYRVYTMAGLARGSLLQLSFTMLTLVIVATLALILGAVGLYGVLSYVVAQRTREIGVRMALGAEARTVRRMVVAQGTRVVIVGVAIGSVVAFASTRALGSLLYNVNATDVPTFAGMAAWMLVVGMLASYIPAHRASKVDPIESLRND